MTATAGSAAAARRRSLQPAAEVALALVSVATIASLWRLFADGSFFPPLLVHVAAAHLVAALCRRRGLSLAASGAVQLVAGCLVITWVHLLHTTAAGVPTTATLEAAGQALHDAWVTFGQVRAPAPVLTGFLVAAGAAMWVAAWLGDVAAFRLWTPFEALIPSGTVFMFASLFAADQSRARAAALWIGSCLVFVLLHRTARQQGSPAWLGSDPAGGTRWLLKVGGVLVVLTVALGFVAGPAAPTYGSVPVYDVGDLNGDNSRTTISPLVEIQKRLLEQANVEMFTVQTTNPDARPYWRLTSLDIFDGNVWSSRGSFSGAGGQLEGLGAVPENAVRFQQQFTISALAAIWLPAAFEPREIDSRGTDVRWEPETGTLIVSPSYDTSDGLTYEVTSELPAFDPAQLQDTGPPPEEIRLRGLDLPANFPPAIRDLAAQVTGAAVGPYAQALALQDFFRNTGGFTYSLNVAPSHSTSAMEDFLFVSKAGYCEQFAGTFAAMARAIGLPARVAVGFTPGIPDPAVRGLYHVRGEHAHAWPEVWINGAGWVPFEPTPGRGSVVTQSYTLVPEQQAVPGDPTTPGTVNENPAPIDGSGIPNDPEASSTTLPPAGATTTTLPTEETTDRDTEIPRWVWKSLLVLSGLVLVAAAALGCVALARLLRREVRRRRAATPDAVVLAAWADAVEDVGVLGISPRSWETPSEVASRMARAVGDDSPRTLAVTVSRAEFAADGATEDDAEVALAAARGVHEAVQRSTTPSQRLLAACDPRPPDRRQRREKVEGPRIQVERLPA
jgi:transglutaminase-like putative cysteine protease